MQPEGEARVKEPVSIAKDFEVLPVGDGSWTHTWYPPTESPEGRPHGSGGVCFTSPDEIVLIRIPGNESWDFPAGRPEEGESWEDTFRREVMEEACALVVEATLLGYNRACCLEGKVAGLVLVRSFWKASVELLDWSPQHEIEERKLVPATNALSLLPTTCEPIVARILVEAGIDLGA